MNNTYELLMVTSAKMTDDESTALVQSFYKYIEEQDGKILYADVWGRRKIAYEIADQTYGIFHLIHVEANGDSIKELYRQTGYNDQILKMFLVSVDDVTKARQTYQELKENPKKNAELIENLGE